MSLSSCEVIVDGSSTISRRAERAVLSIRVESTGTSKQKVSEEVTGKASELQALFKSHNLKDAATGAPTPEAAITWWSMKGISTRTWIPQHYDHQLGRTVYEPRLYCAFTSFSVKFKDFKMLSTIATDLTVEQFVAVDGVRWLLTDETKASVASENRKRAVRNAIEKGEDYASEIRGAGCTMRAVEVTEGGSNLGYGMPQMPQMAQRAGHGGGGSSAGGVDLSPEDVDVTANVKVKFVVD